MTPAVFLDRDGTILDELGYVTPDSHVTVYPWSIDAIRLLKQGGYAVVVVSNQGGIALGLYDDAFVEATHQTLGARFAAGGAHIDGWYYCPHHPDAVIENLRHPCSCRKPLPGLVRDAQHELNLDLARSWVIGDQRRDVQLGYAVGARTILVRTGHGAIQEKTWPTDIAPPSAVCDNLIAAVALLLS